MHQNWSKEEILKRAEASEDGKDQKNNVCYTFLWHGEHCTVNAVQLKGQDGIPLHVHKEHDEVIQICEGAGEVIIGNKSLLMKKGDVFFVPKGVAHCLKFPCVILSLYAPAFDPKHPDREFV